MSEKKCCCKPIPTPPPVECPCEYSEYALFFSDGRLYNSALEGGIFFSEDSISTSGFYQDANIIQILTAGTYIARYILTVPQNETISTTISLQINNEKAEGTIKNFTKNITGITGTISGETIFTVERYASVRLSSSKIINISGSENETLATLVFIKLSS